MFTIDSVISFWQNWNKNKYEECDYGGGSPIIQLWVKFCVFSFIILFFNIDRKTLKKLPLSEYRAGHKSERKSIWDVAKILDNITNDLNKFFTTMNYLVENFTRFWILVSITDVNVFNYCIILYSIHFSCLYLCWKLLFYDTI